MAEIKIEFKWQREMVEDIEEMVFDELIDHLVLVASIGDQMDHRDVWELRYLTKYIKEYYKSMRPEWIQELDKYICPECQKRGLPPSIFYDCCTDCANKKRGLVY